MLTAAGHVSRRAAAAAVRRGGASRRCNASSAAARCAAALDALGVGGGTVHAGGFDGSKWLGSGDVLEVKTPIDNSTIGRVRNVTRAEYEQVVTAAVRAQRQWRDVPAPVRGNVVRLLGEKLRENKQQLGELVTLEMGKVRGEGEGEVQEMIDICDFGVGLSRQLYGLTLASERPSHRMMEQWHPRGVVGCITAFNFPVAVWSWNAAIAAVCGNATLWKPAPKTPLTAIACTRLAAAACADAGVDAATFPLAVGGNDIGEALVNDERVALVSATGSTRMGKEVAVAAARRLCPTILELGGNNALVVTPNANMDLALNAIAFGAVGTAGQRCTTTRRLIVHASVRDELVERLVAAYSRVPIGDPLVAGTLMGPLVSADAVATMRAALDEVTATGGEVLYGDGDASAALAQCPSGGHYVLPAITAAKNDWAVVQRETFAPLLHVIEYGSRSASGSAATDEVFDAIALQNAVPQGLSSAIFTDNVREAELFLSGGGSDCGIANVNIGTSGAEIGGAFGGEKETGGGREAGSNAWQKYMRRATNTVNYGTVLPLAQGVEFKV